MSRTQTANAALESPILQSLEQMPDRDAQKERVKRMTAAELKSLVEEIKGTPKKPSVFESPEVLTELEKRLQEENISFDTDAWQQSSLEQAKAAAMDKAEQGFLKQLTEKGGGWAVLGSAAITILSWLGFSKAKALRNSIKNKGYLRTAVEAAKEHPIFAAFISALGIKASYDLYKYLETNAAPITDAIAQKAKEMGVPGVEAAKTLADQLRSVVGTGIDVGLKTSVMGVAKVFGGSYDEETGVVKIGSHSTLYAPVLSAFQTGIRRKGGPALMKNTFSRFLVEDRLSAVLRQTQHAHLKSAEAVSYKKLMAQRGLDLLNKPHLDASAQAEVERIVGALGPDLGLEGKALERVQVSQVEATEHLKRIQNEIHTLNADEIKSFNSFKNDIDNELLDASEKMKSGKFKGSAKEFKEKAAAKATKRAKEFNDEMKAKKISLGLEYAEALNGLEGTIGEHVYHDLHGTKYGAGPVGRTLEKTTNLAENAMLKMRRIPGGKIILGSVACYSFLPLALEGAAALRPGEEGEAAKKALMIDAADMGIGFIPGVGELNDLRAAFSGTDLNGREIDTKARVFAGVMGGLGAGAIAAGFFTGGTSIVGFKLLRGMFATRKALKMAKWAEDGKTVVNVTQKGLKTLKAAEKGVEEAETMLKITDLNRKARKVQNFLHNGQRGMQLYAYGELGFNLAAGVTEVYNSAEGLVGTAQQKILSGIDAAEELASNVAQKIS